MNIAKWHKVIYLIGFIVIFAAFVFDFYSYRQQLVIDLKSEHDRSPTGQVITHMERSGCFVANSDVFHTSLVLSPCTNRNYYAMGPGTIPLLILIVYGLFPVLYHVVSPLLNQIKAMLGPQVFYMRSFQVVFMGILGVFLLRIVYSFYTSLFSWGGSAVSELQEFESALISIVCLTVVACFVRINWGLHLQNVKQISLLCFITCLHLLPLAAMLFT